MADSERLTHLIQFYELLEALEKRCGGKRTLSECRGRQDWPARGVYFFFEPGEERTTSGTGMRVVRVGTHALTATSKSTLWNRLLQHRGTIKSGGGNHRGSIFRLLVGEAIVRREPSTLCATWGQGTTASHETRQAEQPLEALVSNHIGSMPFLWLEVPDAPAAESKRGIVERNAIALLSNCPRDNGEANDLSAQQWLGQFSRRNKIMRSGLWNQNHVDESYDPAFLEVLTDLVMCKD